MQPEALNRGLIRHGIDPTNGCCDNTGTAANDSASKIAAQTLNFTPVIHMLFLPATANVNADGESDDPNVVFLDVEVDTSVLSGIANTFSLNNGISSSANSKVRLLSSVNQLRCQLRGFHINVPLATKPTNP